MYPAESAKKMRDGGKGIITQEEEKINENSITKEDAIGCAGLNQLDNHCQRYPIGEQLLQQTGSNSTCAVDDPREESKTLIDIGNGGEIYDLIGRRMNKKGQFDDFEEENSAEHNPKPSAHNPWT